MIRKILSLACLALVAFLMGCNNDPDPTPQEPTATIALSDSIDAYTVLSTLRLQIVAMAPSGITSATCKVWQGEQELQTLFTLDSTQVSVSESLSFYLDPSYQGQTLSFTFVIEDAFFNVYGDTVSLQIAASQISYIETDTVGSYSNFKYASFYDVKSPLSYYGVGLSKTATKKTIDFVYYYTKTDKAILSSPSSEGVETVWAEQNTGLWPLFGVENETKFYSLSSDIDYAGISTAVELENALTGKTAVSEIKGLTTGQLIGIRLSDSRGGSVGIMKIKEANSAALATAQIVFEAKVSK